MAAFINTSDLRERVIFANKKTEKDNYGQTVETNENVATVWACIREQMLKDKIATVGTILEGTINIIIRYEQDFIIDNNMRILWNGLEFEIKDINRGIYKKDFTVINAKQV